MPVRLGRRPAPEAAPQSDEVAELKSTLQRVKAEYDNYRKRSLRDQQLKQCALAG